MTSKVVRFEVEGQRRVGLVQEQVDAGHLDAVPFKHRTQNLSGEAPTQGWTRFHRPPDSSCARPRLGLLPPERFLFHGRNDFSVDVHVQVKLEGEALLTGVLQRRAGPQSAFTPKTLRKTFALDTLLLLQIHRKKPAPLLLP